MRVNSPVRRINRFAAYGCALLLAGLSALVDAQQLSLRYHATTEGLGNLVVNVLSQEPGGALWIGTEQGLYRHDGETIRRVEGGPEQDIHSMVFGADGTLWVGGEGGLFRRGTKGFVVAYANEDATWSVNRGQMLAALPDGSVLVVGQEGKLWRVVPHGEEVHLVPALPATLVPSEPHALDVHSILVARDGAWWFGCGDGLCRWYENRLERWGAVDGVPQAEWQGLLEAKDGSIWARSDRYVVRRAAGATQFADVTPQGLRRGANGYWLPLTEDSAGRVLTPGDSGVFRWQAGRWQHLGERNGLTEDGLRAILPDRDGDIWLGTTGHGLAHWRGYDHWSSWTARQGLPSDVVWSIADDGEGRVWIGTAQGMVSTGFHRP
ncbi:MAG: two-component regulator propeller domain-containing protein [Rhodoferax sp.]|nr:two-component regulator propeller domain-containing protein [Rhodoferax sp.]